MIFTLVRLDESSVVSMSGAIFAFESRLVLQVLNIRGACVSLFSSRSTSSMIVYFFFTHCFLFFMV